MTKLIINAAYERKDSGKFNVSVKKPKISSTADTLPMALASVRLKARQKIAEDKGVELRDVDARVQATAAAAPDWIVDYPPLSQGDPGIRAVMTWRREYSNGVKGGNVEVLINEYRPDDEAAEGNYEAKVRDGVMESTLGWADTLDGAIALADEKATPTAQKLGMGSWAHELV